MGKMTDEEMVDSFINEKTEAEENLTLEFAREILRHEVHKKEINGYIKDIKKEAKANGILVGNVTKALKKMKEMLKSTDLEKEEEDHLIDTFMEDFDIKMRIQTLLEKD